MRSVQMRNALTPPPFLADRHLGAVDAHSTPDLLAVAADEVLMVLGQVELHVLLAAIEAEHRRLHEAQHGTLPARCKPATLTP